MEEWISAAALFGETLTDIIWFPTVIWTMITGLVLFMLKGFNHIHSQYHYHIRLALIAALPAGILASYFFETLSTSTETSYIIISVMAPIEVGVTGVESETGYTMGEIFYSLMALVILSGTFYFSFRYLLQWIHLFSFKRENNFYDIETVEGINKNTLQLAAASGKHILIGFSGDEIIPVTFGAVRPVIILPASLRSDKNKMNLAVRHELTHIRQNDFTTHLVVTGIKTFFWYHPFIHVLDRQLTDFREMRCDSLVLSDRTVSKKEYASLLLELLPLPNLNKEISVNMAQESSNLKKRIQMMMNQTYNHTIPTRSSFAILGVLLASLIIAMACTDMQPHKVFDEEELDLMTDMDTSGERGYHQITIFMGDEEQDERHNDALEQLNRLEPEHIQEIEVLKGEKATEAYGERGIHGVILIKTQQNIESYNTTLQTLGMNPVDPGSIKEISEEPEDYFVVVEDMPELIGGLEELQKNITYPDMARRAGIEGRVYIQFIVDENGDVQDPVVIRGIGGGADEEAVKAVSQAKFKPGMQRGKPVRVQYSLPVFFTLQDNNDSDASASVETPEVSSKNMRIENFEHEGNTVNGTVIDGNSDQPLAGANIVVKGDNNGSATDLNGKFSLTGLNSDASQIEISYIGYSTATIDLK